MSVTLLHLRSPLNYLSKLFLFTCLQTEWNWKVPDWPKPFIHPDNVSVFVLQSLSNAGRFFSCAFEFRPTKQNKDTKAWNSPLEICQETFIKNLHKNSSRPFSLNLALNLPVMDIFVHRLCKNMVYLSSFCVILAFTCKVIVSILFFLCHK